MNYNKLNKQQLIERLMELEMDLENTRKIRDTFSDDYYNLRQENRTLEHRMSTLSNEIDKAKMRPYVVLAKFSLSAMILIPLGLLTRYAYQGSEVALMFLVIMLSFLGIIGGGLLFTFIQDNS